MTKYEYETLMARRIKWDNGDETGECTVAEWCEANSEDSDDAMIMMAACDAFGTALIGGGAAPLVKVTEIE